MHKGPKAPKSFTKWVAIPLGISLILIMVVVMVIAIIGWWPRTKAAPKAGSGKAEKWTENWMVLFYAADDVSGSRFHRSNAKVELTDDKIRVSYRGNCDGWGTLTGKIVHNEKGVHYSGEGYQPGWTGTFLLRPNGEKTNFEGRWYSPDDHDPKRRSGSRLQLIRQ